MGVVYEAEQQSLRRRVALKVLPQSFSGDGKSLDRFQREARAAAGMHHTNIVPVFEVGEDEGQVFYAMQLIQGQGLDLVIQEVARLTDSYVGDSGGSTGSGHVADNDRSIAASLITGQFESQQLIESQQTLAAQPEPDELQSNLKRCRVFGRDNFIQLVVERITRTTTKLLRCNPELALFFRATTTNTHH